MKHFLTGLGLVLLLGYFIYYILIHNSDTKQLEKLSIETMVTQVTNDLNDAMPVINEAGYDMSAVSVKSSIPPLVIASFVLEKKVDYETQEKLLKALEGNVIGKLALQSLIEAFNLDQSLEFNDKKLRAIRLFLTIPPAIQVEYK